MSNNIYNILSKLKTLTESAEPAAPEATVYETVEPRGSITEAVRSLESKYAAFKEDKAKPDFLDVDKDGDKAEPFKKAVKDKKDVDEGTIAKPKKDLKKHSATAKRMATQKKADKDHESWLDNLEKTDPDHPSLKYRKQATNEGQGPYELYNPKHPKFKANHDKWMKKNPGKKLADFVAAMKKKEATMNEAAYDEPAAPDAEAVAKRKRLQALKDKQEDERAMGGAGETNTPIRKVAGKAYGGAAQAADANDDLDEAMFPGSSIGKSLRNTDQGLRRGSDAIKAGAVGAVASGAGAGLGVAAQTSMATGATALFAPAMGAGMLMGASAVLGTALTYKALQWLARKLFGTSEEALEFAKAHLAAAEAGQPQFQFQGKNYPVKVKPDQIRDLKDEITNLQYNRVAAKQRESIEEVAPPGAKAERMVKHIKKGYAKDGNLTKKEKGIAYATAWKAKKAGNLEEGTEFKDAGKIKNSAPNMKKAKLAKLKESRVMEETDYFYEKVGKALAGKNPNLDTAGSDFVAAVRKEMIAQGIEPNRARNILMMDEDFLSDVATSYDHCCKEMQPEGVLPNAPLDDSARELDEIAALAGLPVQETDAVYNEVNYEESKDTDLVEGMAVSINGREVDVNSIEVDGVNDWDSPDFADAYITYATFADGTPLSDEELVQLENEHGDLVNQAAHGSLQDRADFIDEEAMGEGNEFSGALAAAKAKGEKEFEVDGKRYTVKEDINVSITANGQEDALNLFRKLAGMAEVETTVIPATPEMPQDLETALAQGAIEPVEEERDIEYVNTPNEKIAPISAAIPNGTDLHRSKMQDPETANRAANPLRKEQQVEENLWKSYESMLADVKAK
jgi:hypothetical protein